MPRLIDKNTNSSFEKSISSQTKFSHLYNKHHFSIVKYFKQKLPTSNDSEDMAQQVFINLARAMKHPEFIFSQKLIYVIARNVLMDYFRWKKSRKVDNLELIDDCKISDGMPSAEKILQGKQRLDSFFKHVDDLPLRCRQVFILHRVNNMSQQEIAEHLGISRNTVQKHMVNAMAKLHSAIGKLEDL